MEISSVDRPSDGVQTEEVLTTTPVTTVIRQQPKRGEVTRYEEWLKEIIPVAQSFCGHQSVSVIRPHAESHAYTIILHFNTVSNLRRWLDSETRLQLIEKIRPYLLAPEAIDIKTGFEFWFTPPPAAKPAKAYKQFLVTLSAIFPLTIVVPWTLEPLFSYVPRLALPGLRHLVIASAIVALMVYVIMPRYTRVIARWLFK